MCKSNNFPSPSYVGQSALPAIPYFLLGDDAFALDENLMKPYAHWTAIRHSRAGHIVENPFGILCARFRVLLRPLELDVENSMQVVRASLVLHNFLMMKKNGAY